MRRKLWVHFFAFTFFIFNGDWEHNSTGQMTSEWQRAACFCSNSGGGSSKGLGRSIKRAEETFQRLTAGQREKSVTVCGHSKNTGYKLGVQSRHTGGRNKLWVQPWTLSWLMTLTQLSVFCTVTIMKPAILQPRYHKSIYCNCQQTGNNIQHQAMTS